MITGTAGSKSELSMACAFTGNRRQGQANGAAEVGLHYESELGRARDLLCRFKVTSDEPRDDRNTKLRHLRSRLDQKTGKLGKIGDPGKYIDQNDADPRPRRNPAHHGNEARRVAAELAGPDVAEIQRPATLAF